MNRFLTVAFATTIFLSAFLLFLVQPLISKIILPWFGGSTGVWATCLVFFQTMLCLGYAYAHFLQRLPIRTQRWCHWGLLLLGAACLPVMPGESWKPLDGNDPAFKISVILLLKTGLPYLALSATGPLLQAWFARVYPEARTYRLYALSNVASLSSLLLFPLWFERVMTSNGLSSMWSLLFIGFVACCGYVAYQVSMTAMPDSTSLIPQTSEANLFPVSQISAAPSLGHYLIWLTLPAFASFMLLAGTNHLCQDIASTPFLWILPLCLYLLSFILCFDAPKWYSRRVYVVMGLIGLYGVVAMREFGETDMLNRGWLANGVIPFAAPILQAFDWYSPDVIKSMSWSDWLRGQIERADFQIDLIGQISMHCIALFAIFMVCHGELAQRKPPARYLTAFYLMISIGGAIGSALVSLVAPFVFPGLWEWLFGLTICIVIFCCLLFQWRHRGNDCRGYQQRYLFFVVPTLLVSGVVLWQSSRLPLDIAAWLEKPKAEASLATDEAEPSMTFEDTDSESENAFDYHFPSHLLPSLAAIIGMILFANLALLGGWEYWFGSPGSTIVQRIVVNAAAIAFGSLYLHDMKQFAPQELFAKRQADDLFSSTDTNVWRGRNFYGALTIEQSENPNFPEDNKRTLQHGRITHGAQLIEPPGRSQPTTYYSRSSGVAIAIDHVSQRPVVRMGAIGLGTGTLAAFAAREPSDSSDSSPPKAKGLFELTIYEINPLVVSLSEGEDPWFTYVQDARKRGADVKIALGDARLMMERQKPNEFDVIAVDAFSGDAIPTHLLTDESMQIYAKHLRSDDTGILAIHISNRYLDLEPVCKALANKFGFEARAIEADDETESNAYSSTWILLTKDLSLTAQLDDTTPNARRLSPKQGILWTDAYSSLYEVLLDGEIDDAVEVVSATHWFQKTSSMRPDVELKSEPRWFRDGWQYFRTWPLASDPIDNHELRVKENRVELRAIGQSETSWKQIE
jgi:hypothetical protein